MISAGFDCGLDVFEVSVLERLLEPESIGLASSDFAILKMPE